MTRAIGSLNMGLCRVLLAPWMISSPCALKTGVYSLLGMVIVINCVWIISKF